MPGRAYRPSTYTADAPSLPLGSMRLPPAATSPRMARTWAREVLSLDKAVDVDSIALVVSELTTNAVVHARTELNVRITAGAGSVRVEVEDGSLQPPERSAHGMGLRVADDVGSAWGWHPVATGKIVWVEVPIGL